MTMTANARAAVELFRKMLDDARECELVADYARCPGTHSFDIEMSDGAWIQVTVFGSPTREDDEAMARAREATDETPSPAEMRALRLALSDPGAIVERGARDDPERREPLPAWQARAVIASGFRKIRAAVVRT